MPSVTLLYIIGINNRKCHQNVLTKDVLVTFLVFFFLFGCKIEKIVLSLHHKFS